MKLSIAFLATTFLAPSLLHAQGQMAMPDYSGTFSSPSETHGFWLQAPVDFEITGLRVPDEKQSGKQNIAVYVRDSISSSATTATPLFFSGGTSSTQILPCSIKVAKSKYLVVLGCGGDAAQQHSSDSASGYAAQILGQWATLSRVQTSTNLINLQGGGAWTADTTSARGIGRVEVYIKDQPALPPIARAEGFGTSSTSRPIGNAYVENTPFNFMYRHPSQIRGYWFRAPTSFVVTGFEVPNENAAPEQVIAFYTFTKDPGNFFLPTASDLKFFTPAPVPSNRVIQPASPIIVLQGEWVVVAGACKDATTYNSSYSSGGMNMSVLGNAFTAERVLIQDDPLKNAGLGRIQFSTGFCGRVRLHVAGQDRFPPFKTPDLATTAPPLIGTTSKLELRSNTEATFGIVLGSTQRLSASIPTPYGDLWVSPSFFATWLIPSRSGELELAIPNDTSLYGTQPAWQGLTIDVLQSVYSMTNGVEWTIGGRLN
ncbi:MAG: hypothetical protein KDC95_05100 [Planctomycetes bacterium]|nr:hypothetical protein [Planctomycetota bacterium]